MNILTKTLLMVFKFFGDLGDLHVEGETWGIHSPSSSRGTIFTGLHRLKPLLDEKASISDLLDKVFSNTTAGAIRLCRKAIKMGIISSGEAVKEYLQKSSPETVWMNPYLEKLLDILKVHAGFTPKMMVDHQICGSEFLSQRILEEARQRGLVRLEVSPLNYYVLNK